MPRLDDPYEKFNRKMFAFNDYADRVLVRPVAKGYRNAVPSAMQHMANRFFLNLESPINIGNDLLQGRVDYALSNTGRLVINSSVGVLGFFDPATEMGIPADDTDFAVTLAKWGVPDGPYLVLPLYGSTTMRDIWRLPVDSFFFDPLYHYSSTHNFSLEAQYLPTLFFLVTLRSSAIDAEGLVEGAFDPYILSRDVYRQWRINKIYRGAPPAQVIEVLQQLGDDTDTEELLQQQQQVERKKK